MGRVSLILAVVLLTAALKVSAQSDEAFFEFIENKGQWDKAVQFRGELSSGSFFLHNNGFTVDLFSPEDLQTIFNPHGHSHLKQDKKSKKIDYSKDLSGTVINDKIVGNPGQAKILHAHNYRVEFVGSDPNAKGDPEKPLDTYNNYFIGNDPSKWVKEARIYNAVVFKNIYPNIDVRYYSESGTLKYDLIVHPGGDPSKIILKYTGADKLILKNSDLIIKTSVGDVKELYPYSYQPDNTKGRKKIDCKFVVSGNTVKFQLAQFSSSLPLIIDPTLVFSSFTGSAADQYGFTATPGPDGSLFSGGIVFSSGFPVTPGAYQTNFAGGGGNRPTDIGIMKFSPNGTQRVYATYIGGGENDYPHSLFSDAQGNLVIMGRSYSSDYPGQTIGVTASSGNSNIIVTKLNAAGSAIIGSLSIGGSSHDGVNIKDLQRNGSRHGSESLVRNYGDDSRSEVILDGGANIYVAAQTQSGDFPVKNGFQMTKGGGNQDGVIMKIDANCQNLLWASYLGGSRDDGAFVLDLNPTNGNIYVGGGTTSDDFPGSKGGTIGPAYNGGQDQLKAPAPDGFVAIISNNGSNLIRSTYIGTDNVDIIYGLKFDRKGFPYVMGVTRGSWAARGNPVPAEFGGTNNSQFIAKLQPNLSDFVYTTTFGNGSKRPNLSPVAFLVDRCENVYISGWGGWISKSEADPYDHDGVVGLPVSANAIKPRTDNNDFYFIVIEKNATQVLYGTYFGQTNGNYGEHVDGGTSRYDQQGVIYQAICANCFGGARFPTTPGVIGPVNGSSECNLAAVKIAFDFAGVASGPRVFFNGVADSVGCAPFTVELRDTILNAVSYEWSFGDGSPDTATVSPTLTHTYQNVGRYIVRLIAIDPNSCNERDTAYATVVVGADKANLAWDFDKIGPCESLQYEFTNLSTPTTKPFEPTSFIWDFGDGSPRIPAGLGTQTHSYGSPGTYVVSLVLNDTAYCNYPDSLTRVIRVNPLVVAQFVTPDRGCAPYDAVFENISLAGEEFTWEFGDGSAPVIDNGLTVTHRYETPGTYTIRLTGRDENTCNKIDDTTMTITVYDRPTAAFTYAPITPEVNKPTIFYNNSIDGVRYIWYFGDGDSTIKNNMDTTLHQYNESGQWNAMLVTFNANGCTDTAYQTVASLIDPLLDVPNAFTPGRFGKNSIIRVEGFGITKMSWKIFNRWGQKVFETNDRRGGWDGTFNGKPLPVDVYTYTLDVQYFDGKTVRKTGDITLIR